MDRIILLAISCLLVTSQQANRPQSATPVETGDAVDRLQQDKLLKALELQNEKELTSPGKLPPPNPQEAAMIDGMRKDLDKLSIAVQKKSYKDIESLSGKIIGGVKFFIPEVEPKQAPEVQDIDVVFAKLAPGCASIIKGLKEGTVSLTQAKAVMLGLRGIQMAAKARK
jgi:hypothetical protein